MFQSRWPLEGCLQELLTTQLFYSHVSHFRTRKKKDKGERKDSYRFPHSSPVAVGETACGNFGTQAQFYFHASHWRGGRRERTLEVYTLKSRTSLHIRVALIVGRWTVQASVPVHCFILLIHTVAQERERGKEWKLQVGTLEFRW